MIVLWLPVLFHVICWTTSTGTSSRLVSSFQYQPAFSQKHSRYHQQQQQYNKATASHCVINIFHKQQHCGNKGLSAHGPYKKNEFKNIARIPNKDDNNKNEKETSLRTIRGRAEDKVALTRRQWFFQSISTCATASSAGAALSIITTNPQSSQAATAGTLDAQDTLSSSSSSRSSSSTSTTIPSTFPKSLCDPSVSTFRNPYNNRIVHILGTAHISSASAEVAGQLVRDIKPSAVFVELDAKRVGRTIPKPNMDRSSDGGKSLDGKNDSGSVTLSGNEQQGKEQVQGSAVVVVPTAPTLTDQSQLSSSKSPFNIKEKLLNKASQVVGNTIKGLYQKLESEGFSAGEEFIVAVREGLNVGSQIVLGDQDVEVTLRRLTEALSKTDMKKLLAADAEIEQNLKQLLPADIQKSVNGSGEMTKEEFRYFVETIKAKENVKMLMANLKSVAPEVYQAMVGERDVYMANGLDRLNQFDSIVAVMGVAHVDGVERTLKERGWEEVKYPKQCI
jgi:hypothetical protein